MSTALQRDVRAVLLPATPHLALDRDMEAFLGDGGTAILLGESRNEYVGRAMSAERRGHETAKLFRAVTQAARGLAGEVIVAVDQEPGGIERLHGLVRPLPTRDALTAISAATLEEVARQTAADAAALGVNLFLAPILDVVTAANPWLANRTLGTEGERVALLGTAFVRGAQSGGVACAAKHFPGYPWLHNDPALEDGAFQGTMSDLIPTLRAFEEAIAAGVAAIMTGPAPIATIDPDNGASTSPTIMAMLRHGFRFDGLIISDDLDAAATMRGHSLAETAIKSLIAGADLLLVGHGSHILDLADSVVEAVETGIVPRSRISSAVAKISSFLEARNQRVDQSRSCLQS